jgi:itaconate CoA-transferase
MLDVLAEWVIARYGPFDTADGSIFLAIQNEREWARFCTEALGSPGLAVDERFATNPDRVANEPALRAIVELGEHPALVERRRWQEIGTLAGPVGALGPPVDISGTQPVMGEVPALGDATERIRAEFGPTRA